MLVMVEELVASLHRTQQSFGNSKEAVDKDEELEVLKDVLTSFKCIGVHSENVANSQLHLGLVV